MNILKHLFVPEIHIIEVQCEGVPENHFAYLNKKKAAKEFEEVRAEVRECLEKEDCVDEFDANSSETYFWDLNDYEWRLITIKTE